MTVLTGYSAQTEQVKVEHTNAKPMRISASQYSCLFRQPLWVECSPCPQTGKRCGCFQFFRAVNRGSLQLSDPHILDLVPHVHRRRPHPTCAPVSGREIHEVDRGEVSECGDALFCRGKVDALARSVLFVLWTVGSAADVCVSGLKDEGRSV